MSRNTDTVETGRPANTPFWVTPRAARIALIAVHVAAFVSVLVEFAVPFPAAGYAVKRVEALDFAGSYAAYGFVSCVLLVLLGKVLRRGVMRRESYYGSGADAS